MRTITITAGHSTTDPGAVNGIFKEADIAQDMRNMCAHYLRAAGVPIRTDGEGKGNAPLSKAIELIKGSSIAVEFHCNAATSKKAEGTEALASEKHRLISQKLCKAINGVTGIPLRGAHGWKPENSGQHSRLGYVRGGGIILELFFISNDTELKIWLDKKWLIAKAVAGVLIEQAKAA